MQPIPRVVDLSHYQYDDRNGKFDWASAKSFGIWGVIWKATESTSYYLVHNIPYTFSTKKRTDELRAAFDLSKIFLDAVLELLILF